MGHIDCLDSRLLHAHPLYSYLLSNDNDGLLVMQRDGLRHALRSADTGGKQPQGMMTRMADGATRLACILALTFAATGAHAQTTVHVGVSQPIFSFVPLDIGIGAGIFAKRGLVVDKTAFNGSAKLHQAIAAGSIDVGLGAGPEFGFISKGSPEKAVAALADRPRELAVSVLKDGPIKTTADLKGKRLSVSTKGSLTEWGGQELSRQQGWGGKGISLLPLGSFGAQVAALKTHQIDGMVVEASTAGRMEEEGVGRTLVTFENLVPDFHIHVAFASDAFINEHPQELRNFLAAWFESVEYMRTQRPESVTTASEVLNLSPSLAGKLYDDLMPMYNPTGHFNAKALDTLAQAEVDMGEIHAKPNMPALLTEQFLPAAKP